MDKQYNKKKQITIIILTVLVLCLTGGLLWYMGAVKKQREVPAMQDVGQEPENEVVVPEIDQEETGMEETETDSTEELPEQNETEAVKEKTEEQKEESEETAGETDVQQEDSGGRTKSPSEAVPPSDPPANPEEPVAVQNPDENGVCQPDPVPQPETGAPANGEKRDGKIYIDGFGWIEDQGGGSIVYEAPNAGTGEIIGDM